MIELIIFAFAFAFGYVLRSSIYRIRKDELEFPIAKEKRPEIKTQNGKAFFSKDEPQEYRVGTIDEPSGND